MLPPRPASGDRIYIIHAYGSVTKSISMLACQYSQPKRPRDLDLRPFDLESDVRVTCVCANFSLPRPLCSRLRPDVRDRQTDRQTSDVHHRLMPHGRGHNKL